MPKTKILLRFLRSPAIGKVEFSSQYWKFAYLINRLVIGGSSMDNLRLFVAKESITTRSGVIVNYRYPSIGFSGDFRLIA